MGRMRLRARVRKPIRPELTRRVLEPLVLVNVDVRSLPRSLRRSRSSTAQQSGTATLPRRMPRLGARAFRTRRASRSKGSFGTRDTTQPGSPNARPARRPARPGAVAPQTPGTGPAQAPVPAPVPAAHMRPHHRRSPQRIRAGKPHQQAIPVLHPALTRDTEFQVRA